MVGALGAIGQSNLGKEKYDKLLLLIGKDWATADYMFLLGSNDIKKLIELIGLTNYNLVRNRFFGMTMTFSLIWFEEKIL